MREQYLQILLVLLVAAPLRNQRGQDSSRGRIGLSFMRSLAA
jgi:hypothetical protein